MLNRVDSPRVCLDEHGMPVGAVVSDWQPPAIPDDTVLEGHWCQLKRLMPAHADALFDAYAAELVPHDWTYLPYGPFESRDSWRNWIEERCLSSDPHFRVIIDRSNGLPAGLASWLRIAPASGSIEVGHVHFAPVLQRRPPATEAMYLMMNHVFTLGYRRYEWKCDALNARSFHAATRLGFTFEGIFRQAMVYKGRNRDTAWFSMIDSEWPDRQQSLKRWLDPSNFDAAGKQRKSLSALRARG